MNKKSILILLIPFLLVSFLSCGNEKENQQSESIQTVELPSEGIEIENIWARPGSENGVSAVYLTILNGSSETDSIVSVSSPVARMVEIHESFEGDDGMMGMRPAENLNIPARDVLHLEPGGLHIMLMNLNNQLAEGDEVEISLEFSNAGQMTITAPVQSIQ